MTPKQDKQGVRTAAHIEQKYELGGFDKAIEAAANAQKTADGASTKAQSALNTAQKADETANAATTQATNTQASLETLSQTVATNTENIGKLDVRVQTLEKGGTGGGEAGADGEDGATFIPYVSAEGVISWTNDKGLANPTPVNIKGAKGDDFTYDDFTAEQLAALKGEKGDDGYTPIKGVDYFDGEDGQPGKDGADGSPGTPATINGVNALTIEAGDNIELEQSGSVLTIKGTGGGDGGSEVYIGETAPTDENVSIWLNPNGESDKVEIEVLTVEEVRAICT